MARKIGGHIVRIDVYNLVHMISIFVFVLLVARSGCWIYGRSNFILATCCKI